MPNGTDQGNYTRVLKGNVQNFLQKYDEELVEVIESRDFEKHLEFMEHYTDAFPTFGQCIYEAIFRRDAALNSTYTDFMLETLQPGKEELPKVGKARKRYEKGKQKQPFYVDYYDKAEIQPLLEEKGMEKTDGFRFRYQQDPALFEHYSDYKLTQVKNGASPDPLVEAYSRQYGLESHSLDFYEFYYRKIYVFRFLFRQHPQLCSRYTDFSLEHLKEGMTGWEEAEEQKKAYKKEYEKNPSPTKPFWLYFCEKYYRSLEDRLPAREAACQRLLEFARDWRYKLRKQGFLFLHNTKESASVRNIAFHLAFALELDVSTLRQILKKGLLQTDFNPKDLRETVCWYCLEHKTGYSDMVCRYLQYMETEEFSRESRPLELLDIKNPDTVYWETRLQRIVGKDENAFLQHLWLLKYARTEVPRKTPKDIFWENFCCFPGAVWTGKNTAAQKTVTPQIIYRELLENSSYYRWGSEAEWMAFAEGKDLNSLENMFRVLVAYDTCMEAKDPTPAEEKKERKERTDILESDYINALIRSGVVEKPDSSLLRMEEYQILLPLILTVSRQNYAAENTMQLLPRETLKKLFGDLDYTNSSVESRRLGNVPVSRTEIIATKFISFFGDAGSEESGTRSSFLEAFDDAVSDDLEVCGLNGFYLRSPFELFMAMCFLHQDPLAYFMASWEAVRS